MSPVNNSLPVFFQTLQGKTITFTADEQNVINGLQPLQGGEWIGKIKKSSSVLRKDRDALKTNLKRKLLALQGPYCIYCGLHHDHCGSKLEREHIAPKGKKNYPMFVFEPLNLCLACSHCNCDLKKEEDVASRNTTTYDANTFTIIHPYFDNIHDHLDGIADGKGIIKVKNKSAKGRKTVDLFDLISVRRTELRCGLIRMYEERTGSKYETLFHQITGNKYVPK